MRSQKQVANLAICTVHSTLAQLQALLFADKKGKNNGGQAAAAPPDIFVGLYAGPDLER